VNRSGRSKIDIEAPDISKFLPSDLVDLLIWEHLTAGCLLYVRQRHESCR